MHVWAYGHCKVSIGVLFINSSTVLSSLHLNFPTIALEKSQWRVDKSVLLLKGSIAIETLQKTIHREDSQNKKSERHVLPFGIQPLCYGAVQEDHFDTEVFFECTIML